MTEREATSARWRAATAHAAPLPIANIAVDLSGAVIAWNVGAERLFGWTEAEVIGRRLPSVPGYLWPAFKSLLEAATHDLPIASRAARHKRRDGDELELDLSAALLRDPSGRVSGLSALLTEVDGTVSPTQAKLAGVTSPGNARLEAVGRLAGGVAHDFNNILTAIAGYAGLLALELRADDPMQSDVAEIRKATERASRLTRQLLAFGRRDAQEPQRLDVNEVVTDVLPMMRQLVGEHIELITNAAVALPAVFGDPGQLEQVLVNLVLNARDAMPGGGRLVVSTGRADLDETFVAGHAGSRAGAFVRLAVEDTGTGMETDILTQIFEPYFTTKEPGRGTGLGLSTVYGIVKANGGYIWVDSVPGRGTMISVYLPARQL